MNCENRQLRIWQVYIYSKFGGHFGFSGIITGKIAQLALLSR